MPRYVRPVFWLWPEHEPVLRFWGVVGDQWRVDGEGRKHSLDHAAVEAAMRMQGIPRADRAELFDAVRVMAAATLAAWQRRRDLVAFAASSASPG